MTRRLILQKARGHTTGRAETLPNAPTACRHTVSGTISQPLTGALFTFPSRYSSTIGHQEVFRLTRWSWQIHTGFLEPRATRAPSPGSPSNFAYPALTVYGTASQRLRLSDGFITPRPVGRPAQKGPTTPNTQRPPAITRARFSLLRFRSPLLTESQFCFLFLRVLRCFTSPRYHQPPYTFRRRRHHMTGARFPHSDIPGSTSGWRLPEA
jgi:hypothetical protein